MPYFTAGQIQCFLDDGKEFHPADTSQPHFGHEHPLIRREISHYCAALRCKVCLSDIRGGSVIRCCEKCGFFLHERCTDLPQELRLLDVDPNHPLTLGGPEKFCDICLNVGSFMYSCHKCNLRLDVGCALAIMPCEEKESVEAISHEHPLQSFCVKEGEILRGCEVCRVPISGKVYGCFACQFYLHERCVDTPCEIQSPSHSLAPRFMVDRGGIYCGGCGSKLNSTRHCSNCDFSLHVNSPVSLVELRPHDGVECKVCDLNISGGQYMCFGSGFFVHTSCINIPWEILHYLHPEHNLILGPNLSKFFLCRACMSGGKPAMTFSCPGCNFDLHAECALRTLESVKAGVCAEIKYPLYNEPLKLGYVKDPKDSDYKCLACKKHLKGLSYFISRRGIRVWLHKSCAELKSEIKHQFHPQHLLTLRVSDSDGADQLRCNACRRRFDGFSFFCRECEFYLDFSCVLREPTFKHHLHEHKLAYFEEAEFLECNLCHGHCHVDLSRCVLCDFNIHQDCIPLPRVVKSRHHSYPFTLVKSIVEDESGEYYCDICQKERNINLGAYYCATGRVIVHIECVLPMLNFEQKTRDDLGLNEVNEEIAHLKAALKDIEEQRDEIERKREEMTRKLRVAERRRSTLSL